MFEISSKKKIPFGPGVSKVLIAGTGLQVRGKPRSRWERRAAHAEEAHRDYMLERIQRREYHPNACRKTIMYHKQLYAYRKLQREQHNGRQAFPPPLPAMSKWGDFRGRAHIVDQHKNLAKVYY